MHSVYPTPEYCPPPLSVTPACTGDDSVPAPMRRALELACQALYLSSPNPRVGCVITAADGSVLGEGFTQQAGGPHAEVMALRDALARGHDVAGSTAWVTLEPCAHTGRTGPCCDALARAGIGRVVASLQDPNPLVAGQGFDRLRAAGVEVHIGPGAAASRELNPGFFRRMEQGLPWVRLKVAASLDGGTALSNGVSQWLTSAQARADGHAWRARACTVLTGIGTVLHDNPRLSVRAVPTPRQPRVAVVDARLEMPLHASVLEAQGGCLIYTTDLSGHSSTPGSRPGFEPESLRERARQLQEERGAHIIGLPAERQNSSGIWPASVGLSYPRVNLHAMLRDLAARGTNELHVEAGGRLNGALLQAGLVDEVLLYQAPMLLGADAKGMARFGPLKALHQAVHLDLHDMRRVGHDVRMLLRVIRQPDAGRMRVGV